ncbi:MAG: Xaa-Pro dipeptidase [Gammaproteobacteria bacterium]|nr:Xaa-Pro dipeptidase [Gammaproteobacteria bacterium]
MNPANGYAQHVAHLQDLYEQAIDGRFEGVLLHSGGADCYFADDREISFQAYGHFGHWLPVNRPNQFLLVRPGRKPVYYQVVPADYWYEQDFPVDEQWREAFDLLPLASVGEIPKPGKGTAYLGPDPEIARRMGVDSENCNPESLVGELDFARAIKTPYETEQMRAANRLALRGHQAARMCFLAGGSEFDIHLAFLEACRQLEEELPYTPIIALDEKSAILHYQYKRRELARPARVLLIDAGCRVNGYCSDVTRTWTAHSANPLFTDLVAGMDGLQQELVREIRPGTEYVDLHLSALRKLADLLLELDICRGDAGRLWELQIPQLFMPHGVGHLLGVQVHDVGGRQRDGTGVQTPPPDHSPALRTTRGMVENMVFTVEPGCYFIPLLLEPARESPAAELINWDAVDALYDHGGVRIEDNVRVTADGVENLTRNAEATAAA